MERGSDQVTVKTLPSTAPSYTVAHFSCLSHTFYTRLLHQSYYSRQASHVFNSVYLSIYLSVNTIMQ